MNDNLTIRGKALAEVMPHLRLLKESPERYIRETIPEKYSDPRPCGVPILSQITRGLGRDGSMLAIGLLIHEVNDFFNIRGKMNDAQIALTAEMILDSDTLYDLTLGNIKACFRQKMASAKIYDRLDGNIILGWLREFKSDMADYCESIYEGNERARRRREEEASKRDIISYSAYLSMLKERAEKGDGEARGILSEIDKRSKIQSPEEIRKKEIEFQKFRLQYEQNKKSKSNINS